MNTGKYVRKDMRDALIMASKQRAAVFAQTLDGFFKDSIFRRQCPNRSPESVLGNRQNPEKHYLCRKFNKQKRL